MATTNITLTGTWQEVATGAFTGQSKGGYDIQIRNDDALPVGDQAFHNIDKNDNLNFSVPSAGAWYGRCIFGNTTVVVTDLG